MNKIVSWFYYIYHNKEGEHILRERDYWFYMLFCDPIAVPLVRRIVKHKIKNFANMVTVSSIPLALISGYSFATGNLISGALFYYLYLFTDILDGKIARGMDDTSDFGGKLDFYSDRVCNLLIYIGLWYGLYYSLGLGCVGFILMCFHYSINFVDKDIVYTTRFKRVAKYFSGFEESGFTLFIAPLLDMVHVLFPLSMLVHLLDIFVHTDKVKMRNVFKRIV